jgi:hypothetical protein
MEAVTSWPLTGEDSYLPPYRVTIDIDSFDDAAVKSRCLDKASLLRADVLLNIVEANQMWPSIKGLCSSLPAMAQNWSKVRKVLKSASGGYLAWKFGISPVLSDMNAILSGMKSLKNDLKRHAEGEHFRVFAEGHPSRSFDAVFDEIRHFDGEIPIDFLHWGIVERQRPTVRYVLVAKPKVQYKTSLFQKLDYALSRFATSPANLAWEKIPFSFVLDWFVDVSGALRMVDQAVGFSPYDIKSFTRSLSYEYDYTVEHEYKNACNGSSLGSYLAGTCSTSHYERQPVSADLPITLRNRFGKNQAAISAALITQMILKSTRVRLDPSRNLLGVKLK